MGNEYGTTTGRPRRCGWYDLPIARYAARINGVTDFVLTKLDVLTGLEQIPVCVAYEVDGERYDEMPMTQTDFHHARPVYEYFHGWSRGHLQGAHPRGPALQRAEVRRLPRGTLRGTLLGDRRRSGPRRDHHRPPPGLNAGPRSWLTSPSRSG